MRLYYEIALRSFRRASTYRVAFLSGLLTNAFFGAVYSFLYLAIYAGREQVGGYTASDAISYLWAAQALISSGAAWVTSDLARSIRTGDVAVDLMRPWNYYGYWLSQELGDRGFNTLLRGSMTYTIGVLYFGARLPAAQDLPGIVAAVTLALLVSCAYTFLLNASAFWLIDPTGVINLGSITTMALSGFLIPLAFLPPELAAVARALPFQALTSLPIEIFLGKQRGLDLAAALGVQLMWAVLLTAAALAVMRAAVRKVVIQGG